MTKRNYLNHSSFIPTEQNRKDVIVLMQPAAGLSSWLLLTFTVFSAIFSYITYRQTNKHQSVSATPAMLPKKLNNQYQVKIHQILDTFFSEEELEGLCFELGLDYEDLPSEGQSYKARDLVVTCHRLGLMEMLTSQIKHHRPQLLMPTRKPQSLNNKLPIAA